MPQAITPELAGAGYASGSKEFWPLFRELAEMVRIARQEDWHNPTGAISRTEAVRLVEDLTSSLHKKLELDFPDNLVSEVTLTLPAHINLAKLDDELPRVAFHVIQHAHDKTQASKRSFISIPDALRVLHLLYDNAGVPILGVTGDTIILGYLHKLMEHRIIKKSKSNSTYTSIAYSTWMGNNNSRNHITQWIDTADENKVYYYLSKMPKKSRRSDRESVLEKESEYERAWKKVESLGIDLKAIVDAILSRISEREQQIIIRRFPRNILKDLDFQRNQPFDFQKRKNFK